MSEQGNFTGGFIAGAILGGGIGGVVGVVVTSWSKNLAANESTTLPKSKGEVKLGTDGVSQTRRNLEDQIAQIRSTMDDMSEQLGTVIEQTAATNAVNSQVEP